MPFIIIHIPLLFPMREVSLVISLALLPVLFQALINILLSSSSRRIQGQKHLGVGLYKVSHGCPRFIEDDALKRVAKSWSTMSHVGQVFMVYLPDIVAVVNKAVHSPPSPHADMISRPIHALKLGHALLQHLHIGVPPTPEQPPSILPLHDPSNSTTMPESWVRYLCSPQLISISFLTIYNFRAAILIRMNSFAVIQASGRHYYLA